MHSLRYKSRGDGDEPSQPHCTYCITIRVVLSRPLGRPHPYRWEGICHSCGRRKSSKGRDCRRTLFSFFSLADPLGHAEGLENMSICVRESEEDWPGREIDF